MGACAVIARSLVLLVTGALFAGFASAASPSPERVGHAHATSLPWRTGTVTVIANINHTFNGKDEYGAPATLTEKAIESTTYTLTGKSAGANLIRAAMSGSGTRTATWKGGQPGTCKGTTTQTWSYMGPAAVKLVYNAGQLYIFPMPQTGSLRSAVTGCEGLGANQQPTVQRTQLPLYRAASGFVKESERARFIAGRKVFPISETVGAMGLTGVIGATTIRWALNASGKACVNPGGGKCP
jgi:hypothetical protein